MKTSIPVLSMVWFLALVGVVGVGCDMRQSVVLARQLGIASAATWIGVDNPTHEEIIATKKVVEIVRGGLSSVGDNESYYLALSPVVEDHVLTSVAANERAMVRLSSAWFLTGLDTLFAMHPDMGRSRDDAVAVGVAFCDGAVAGLSLSAADPIIVAASGQLHVRAAQGRVRIPVLAE